MLTFRAGRGEADEGSNESDSSGRGGQLCGSEAGQPGNGPRMATAEGQQTPSQAPGPQGRQD